MSSPFLPLMCHLCSVQSVLLALCSRGKAGKKEEDSSSPCFLSVFKTKGEKCQRARLLPASLACSCCCLCLQHSTHSQEREDREKHVGRRETSKEQNRHMGSTLGLDEGRRQRRGEREEACALPLFPPFLLLWRFDCVTFSLSHFSFLSIYCLLSFSLSLYSFVAH